MPYTGASHSYNPAQNGPRIDTHRKKIILLTDVTKDQSNLQHMIDKVVAIYGGQVEVINLRNIRFSACLGCCVCALDNECAFMGKDDYVDFYNKKLVPADILIYAGTITDRYLSSIWKKFYDRSFFNTHKPSLPGKQYGFLISGPLSQLPDLRTICDTEVQIQLSNIAGYVSDESPDSADIDHQLESLADRLVRLSVDKYLAPQNFLGVGGTKIFRDDIYGWLRFPFVMDHKYYKKNGYYDFPGVPFQGIMMNLIFSVLKMLPPAKKNIRKMFIQADIPNPLEKYIK